jgi:hypothetical protein
MPSPLDFLDGQEPAPDGTPTPTPEPAAEAPLRGPDGKFASAQPEPAPVVEPAPAPAAEPVKPEPGHVPLSALMDERDKRKAAEERAAALEAAKPAAEPAYIDPDTANAILQERLNNSEEFKNPGVRPRLRFLPYMSDADLNKGGIILTRYELQEEAGKTINIPFIGRLKGSGVTGSAACPGRRRGGADQLQLPDQHRLAPQRASGAEVDQLQDRDQPARRRPRTPCRSGSRRSSATTSSRPWLDGHRHVGRHGELGRRHRRQQEHLGGGQLRPRAVRQAEVELLGHLRDRRGQRRHHQRQVHLASMGWPSAWPRRPTRASGRSRSTPWRAASSTSPSTARGPSAT